MRYTVRQSDPGQYISIQRLLTMTRDGVFGLRNIQRLMITAAFREEQMRPSRCHESAIKTGAFRLLDLINVDDECRITGRISRECPMNHRSVRTRRTLVNPMSPIQMMRTMCEKVVETDTRPGRRVRTNGDVMTLLPRNSRQSRRLRCWCESWD
jgi:hypothetical protein